MITVDFDAAAITQALGELERRVSPEGLKEPLAAIGELLSESTRQRFAASTVPDNIRARYPLDEELYFARIGIGSLTGLYQPSESEMQELASYGAYVESVREWGRRQRAAMGL